MAVCKNTFPVTKLRKVLDSKGLRYVWVAKKAEINPVTFSSILCGRTNPTPKEKKAVSNAIGEIVNRVFD